MYTLPQYFLSGSDGAGPPPFKTSNFFIEGDFESTILPRVFPPYFLFSCNIFRSDVVHCRCSHVLQW
jgi:hypothetical protein